MSAISGTFQLKAIPVVYNPKFKWEVLVSNLNHFYIWVFLLTAGESFPGEWFPKKNSKNKGKQLLLKKRANHLSMNF